MKNYIAWSKDKDNLLKSSSGGIFYELAKEVIKNKGAVVGVMMPGETPYYRVAFDLEQVQDMRGSKYLRARLDPVIEDIFLPNKIPVLFVGLPCTIAAMRKKYPNKINVIYVELRCNGVIKKEEFKKCLSRKWIYRTISSLSYDRPY